MNEYKKVVLVDEVSGEALHFSSQQRACAFLNTTPSTLKKYITTGDEFKGYFVDYEFDEDDKHLSDQSILQLRKIVALIRSIEQIENVTIIT